MSVADLLGVEMSTQMVKEAAKLKIEIAFNKSYPLGVADLSNEIREMVRLSPDAFFAFSYLPDTFMLQEQSMVLGFSPPIYYSGVGTVFPAFYAKAGARPRASSPTAPTIRPRRASRSTPNAT